MQVLVALGLEPGQVLSRDDLIALCWDGRIVGDNAINRVISLLRQALAEVTGDAVRLETITKVGFRVVVAPSAASSERPAAAEQAAIASGSRRRMFVGGLAATALGATGLAWWRPEELFGHRADPRAVALRDEGMALQKTAGPGTMEQAIANYKRAVAIDPDYADGWGALAQGYMHSFAGFSGREKTAAAALLRSAARRALALDPDQPDADTALTMVPPFFGNYVAMDKATLGLLQRHPDYWYAVVSRARFLRDVGRAREAVRFVYRVVEIDPNLPVGWGNIALTHLLAGQLQQADIALDQAQQRWPSHGYLWDVRQQVLLESGRFDEAAAVALDPRQRPDFIPKDAAEARAALARAIGSRDRSSLDKARGAMVSAIGGDPMAAVSLAPLLALMGFPDDALDALTANFEASARSPDLARQTSTAVLFRGPIIALRNDPRFTHLTRVSGLDAYWRGSGSQPDFRRG